MSLGDSLNIKPTDKGNGNGLIEVNPQYTSQRCYGLYACFIGYRLNIYYH